MRNTIIALSTLLILSACTNNKTITIGGIVDMTGESSPYGIIRKKSADLRIKQINDAGGINGHDIEILWHDGQGKRDKASEAVTEIIKDKHVNIIFGGSCEEETLGIADVTNKNNILQIAPSVTGSEISQTTNFTFRTTPSNNKATEIISKYIIDQNEKKIGVILEPNYENKYTQEQLKSFLSDKIYEEIFSNNKNRLITSISNFQENEITTIFLNIYSPSTLKTILETLISLNFNGTLLCNQFVLNDLSNGEQNKLLPFFANVIGVEFTINKENPQLENFIKQFKEYYKDNPKFINYIATTVDAVDVLAEVLFLTKNHDNPYALREAMAIIQHPGISGTITFNKNGNAKDRGSYTLVHFNGTTFIPFY